MSEFCFLASIAFWPDGVILIAIGIFGILASILGGFAIRENNRRMRAIRKMYL